MNVYTDHQGLQYFNTKQKLNSREASWYLRMSEFIYHIHYRPGTKIGKPDGLSWRSGEVACDTEDNFFNEGQFMVLVENENEHDCEAGDMELEEIDVAG